MTKQEFRIVRRRYRRACRDTFLSWKELDRFSPENPAADEVYECFMQLLKEFVAAVGLTGPRRHIIAADMLNINSREV